MERIRRTRRGKQNIAGTAMCSLNAVVVRGPSPCDADGALADYERKQPSALCGMAPSEQRGRGLSLFLLDRVGAL